jgi:hypothetical protein
MSEQALIVTPKAQITIGGKSIQDLVGEDLVEQMFKDMADKLVLRAESIEIIGNDRMQAVAAAVQSDISKFIKERNNETDAELRPFKDAVKKINNALEILLAPLIEQKTRIGTLTSRFEEHKRKLVEEERRKQAAETARIERERQAIEQEKIRLQEQKDAAAIAAMQPAPPSHQTLGEVCAPAAPAAPVPDAKAIQQREQELNLKQAELNRQSAEASKVIEAPKVEGMAVTTKWTFRLIGNTEGELRASMEKAFKAHPEWFDLKCRTRVIEAAVKAADGKLECDGLLFFQDTKTRPI